MKTSGVTSCRHVSNFSYKYQFL